MTLLAACGGGDGDSGGGGDTGSSGGDALADLEPMTLRASVPFPSTGTPGQMLTAFAEDVDERTDGKVTIEPYFDATLVPAAESFSGLSSGLTDIGFFAASNQPNELPVSNWVLQLAPSATNVGFPVNNLAGEPATAAIFNNTEAVRAELEQNNIVPLMQMSSGPFSMLCDEPVATPDEAAGKTIRTGGEPWVTEVGALGMTNVFMPPAELYEALQRGVVNCAYLAADNIAVLGLEEVAQALMLVDGGFSAGAQIAFNKDVWDALPDELKTIMQDSAAVGMAAFEKGNSEIYKLAVEVCQEAGLEFPEVEELNAVIHESREGKLEELLANPVEGIDDPQAISDQYVAYVEEWVEFVESDLGVESIDPGEATVDELVEAYTAGGDSIDWDAYSEQFATFLKDLE
jgi:TRAP-type C4-dicarboxylate transport system substrate-binding protein